MIHDLLAPVQAIALDAGRAAVDFYGQDIPVEAKADDSPLTLADQASHRLITSALTALTPDIPVLSEESKDTAAISETSGDRLWVVDPLDGTKEFIKQTGQFTVNIALLEYGWPVLGVVHVPVSGVTYLGLKTAEQTGSLGSIAGRRSRSDSDSLSEPGQADGRCQPRSRRSRGRCISRSVG